MSLSIATFLAGSLLLAAGLLTILYPETIARGIRSFPRSRACGLVLLVSATAIVLYEVRLLGEADFGKYKNILFAFFLLIAVGAWFKVPDFLGVRALSVLGLLFAGALLQSAFLEAPETRLFLVVFAYGLIVASLYLAAAPFRLRDWITAIDQNPGLRKGTGFAFTIYGLALCLIPLTY